ncbi:MAG: FliA/WhiG family RNA polymerase sigma factor [Proteobacteria bacterium]|nr:FliA/WhiG family RNA polymerase sigma factor [Pseudomonadota bacterium]MBU1685963.1 FliA/WhiG family RNA polymerase sigma factor [Pseudomonadota bacterium]
MINKNTTPKIRDYTKYFFAESGKLDQEKRNELIASCTPLIKYIAMRLASRLPAHISLDDLMSSGIIGLIDAIDKFDPLKNVQFKTYAEFRIKGAMLDELRSLDYLPRSIRKKSSDLEKVYGKLEKKLGRPAEDDEIAEELNLEIDAFHSLLNETKAISFIDIDVLRKKLPGQDQDENLFDSLAFQDEDPYATISYTEIRDILAAAIYGLPEKEKLVVTLYYHEELTMKEIGVVMDYTESRISQMHSKAMLRLRSKLSRALADH